MDYKKLWTQFKEDLERWDRQGGFDKPKIESYGDVLETMQKREEQE